MDKKRFERLMESVKQMDEIACGEREPSWELLAIRRQTSIPQLTKILG